MIHLKAIQRGADGFPVRFAVLVEPNVPMECDADLYAAVRTAGTAIIVPFDATSIRTERPEEVPAAEFERTWQGD